MPTLDWIGKDKVVNHHLDVPYRVLERVYSYDQAGQHDADNGSENMIIHGDNLEALKSLLPQYEGRVKCIYIDPPYNTGEEKWVYNDNVNDPRMVEWLNDTVGKEGEDLSRHDKWLCMMYPRLRLLQKLLAEDGVIFISISFVELYTLKSICDEIFGYTNFVAQITWQNNYSPRNDAKGIPAETDNILVYSKTPGWEPKRLARTSEMDARYVNYDDDIIPYKVTPIHAPGASSHKGMVYAIQHPMTGELMYPPRGRHWKDQQKKLLRSLCEWAPYELKIIDDQEKRMEICGEDVDASIPAIMLSKSIEESKFIATQRYAVHPWPSYFFLSKGLGSIQAKTYLDPSKGKVVSTLWQNSDVGTNVDATNELKSLLPDGKQFDTPKPVKLLDRIVQIATDSDSIILDSFAGTGTTAHSVLKANMSDGGHRRFILVELMDYADTKTAERIKRVISGYRTNEEKVLFDEEISLENLVDGGDLLEQAKAIAKQAKGQYSKVSKPKLKDGHLRVIASVKATDKTPGIPGDFSFYELGAPLFIGENLNEDVDIDKIRAYVYFTETRQPITPTEAPYYLGSYVGNAYYFYYERDKITVLNQEYLNTIQTPASHYVIYADQCTLTEEELSSLHITFKKIPRDISRL